MRKAIQKYFLLLTLLFAFAFSSAGKTHPAGGISDKNALVLGIPQLPHNDLDEVRQPVVNGGQIAVQKNVSATDLVQGRICYRSLASFESLVIKASSLLVKDHLSQNYPTHNFW